MIPNDLIKKLINETDIVDVIGKRLPLNLEDNNSNIYSAICPFHKEKIPSFTVNQDRQLYYCLGCGAGGNVFNFLMTYDQLSFVEAAEYLAFQNGTDIPHSSENNENLYSAMLSVASLYHNQLVENSNIIRYLSNRNLNKEIIKQFNLGYAKPGWDTLSKQFSTQAKQQHLLQTGMLIKKESSQTFDRFRDRIMFPIRDISGRVAGFGGRIINPEDHPKYLNSPETTIFNKSNFLYGLYEARKNLDRIQQLLVVEGYMDVISLAKEGIWGAVATLGTSVNSNHIKQLMRHSNDIIFCFDGDIAGQKAAKRALDTCLPYMSDIISIKFLFLPQDEDPDSIIQKEGKEAFMQRINQAIPLCDYIFKISGSDSCLDNIESLAKMTSQVIAYRNKLPDHLLLKMTIAQKLNDMTNINVFDSL